MDYMSQQMFPKKENKRKFKSFISDSTDICHQHNVQVHDIKIKKKSDHARKGIYKRRR